MGVVMLVLMQHIHINKYSQTAIGVCAYTYIHVQTHLHINMRMCAYICTYMYNVNISESCSHVSYVRKILQ